MGVQVGFRVGVGLVARFGDSGECDLGWVRAGLTFPSLSRGRLIAFLCCMRQTRQKIGLSLVEFLWAVSIPSRLKIAELVWIGGNWGFEPVPGICRVGTWKPRGSKAIRRKLTFGV